MRKHVLQHLFNQKVLIKIRAMRPLCLETLPNNYRIVFNLYSSHTGIRDLFQRIRVEEDEAPDEITYTTRATMLYGREGHTITASKRTVLFVCQNLFSLDHRQLMDILDWRMEYECNYVYENSSMTEIYTFDDEAYEQLLRKTMRVRRLVKEQAVRDTILRYTCHITTSTYWGIAYNDFWVPLVGY